MRKTIEFTVTLLSLIFVIMFFVASNKPTVEVVEINCSPYDILSRDGRTIISSVLSELELKKVYRYMYNADNSVNFNPDNYRRKHPEDAVEMREIVKPDYDLTVYSDHLPDPEFFRIK